jgi:hypothetical protein
MSSPFCRNRVENRHLSDADDLQHRDRGSLAPWRSLSSARGLRVASYSARAVPNRETNAAFDSIRIHLSQSGDIGQHCFPLAQLGEKFARKI